MTTDKKWNDSNWQGNKWEFYKDPDGLWHWRTVAPAGWDAVKGEWKAGAQWQDSQWEDGKAKNHSGKNWDWTKQEVSWVELARSPEGYKNKTECEASARKYGWA